MYRTLKLTKYRNIGLEEPQTFVINHSIKKEEIGDLVILIGSNNSGKSNVLSALKSLFSGGLTERDVTTLSFDPADLKPEISFGIHDENGESIYYNLRYGEQPSVFLNLNDKKHPEPTKASLLADVRTAIGFANSHGIPVARLQTVLAQLNETPEESIHTPLVDEIVAALNLVERQYFSRYGSGSAFNRTMPQNGYWKSTRNTNQAAPLDYANQWCMNKYGVPFMPSIIVYQEKQLNSNDLNTTPQGIGNSLFFRSLFRTIGVNPDEINNAYQQYQTYKNPATLAKIKKKLDGKIKTLNDQFNRMYFAESDQYKFSIEFDGNNISFGMARGRDEDPIMIEQQSTGFRWFFDLFFNFICSNELKPGDIIIMDEPATNLHPKGQQELRDFIKSFAKQNGLTFVIATHSPFLIDTDNFDELRVVSMENNRSKIDNLFSAVNFEDPDSLLPIKESLTIEQNVLYNLKTEVVWVEGITDYNYLTMFKNLFGIKNIAFLPCNGIGKTEEAQKAILKRLISIEFHRRNLLCDGDKAGKKMKALCKGTAFDGVVLVSDLSEGEKTFTQIEDLFSPEDREKYGLPKKKGAASSLMKATCTLDDFTEETINNFRKLFDLLID